MQHVNDDFEAGMPQTGPQAVFAEPVASGEYSVVPSDESGAGAPAQDDDAGYGGYLDAPQAGSAFEQPAQGAAGARPGFGQAPHVPQHGFESPAQGSAAPSGEGDPREFPVRPADVRHEGAGFAGPSVPSQDAALLGHGGLTGPQPVFGEDLAAAQPAFRALAPEQNEAELGELDEGPGVAQYAGVDMSGPAGPAKAGIPSSGNWQMPEWMREETEANKAAGPQGGGFDEDEMKRDRSRTLMFGGIGVLALGLFVALAVVVLGNDDAEKTDAKSPGAVVPGETDSPAPEPGDTLDVPERADKPLKRFKGPGSPVVGTISDPVSGLVYPQLGGKWVVPTKQNKLAQPGWTGQQIMVTEHVGTQYWYGTILSAPLGPVERRAAAGGDLKNTAVTSAASLQQRLYAFKHTTKPVASQALTVGGKKGWMVADYLGYKRPGIKATGEVVVTAVIDTGKQTPSVLFISMPSTSKKSWADITTILTKVKVAP